MAGLRDEREGYGVEQLENSRDKSPIDSETESEFTPAEQKKIIHRIDRRLIITVGIMYCISLMDRTNLSAAAIAGMREDLTLIGFRYSIITLVFFITYVLFQPPATVACKKIGPRNFLATITFLWGCVMIGMGFANEWSTLAGLRVILGVFEAGFFPGCVYLLSTWYARYEMGKRYAYFYLIGMFASACSGILAFGLMQMGGLADLGGWRWIVSRSWGIHQVYRSCVRSSSWRASCVTASLRFTLDNDTDFNDSSPSSSPQSVTSSSSPSPTTTPRNAGASSTLVKSPSLSPVSKQTEPTPSLNHSLP